jgi:hypothetical protein
MFSNTTDADEQYLTVIKNCTTKIAEAAVVNLSCNRPYFQSARLRKTTLDSFKWEVTQVARRKGISLNVIAKHHADVQLAFTLALTKRATKLADLQLEVDSSDGDRPAKRTRREERTSKFEPGKGMIECEWNPLYREVAPSVQESERGKWNGGDVPIARSEFKMKASSGTLVDRNGRCGCMSMVVVDPATCACVDEALCRTCARSYSTWRRHATKRMGSNFHQKERARKRKENLAARMAKLAKCNANRSTIKGRKKKMQNSNIHATANNEHRMVL